MKNTKMNSMRQLALVLAFFCAPALVARPAQEWMADLDKVLAVPDGLVTGRLTVGGKDRSMVWDFSLYRKNTDQMFFFQSQRRGLELKLLYKRSGEVCWLWDRLRSTMFRKRDLEKFESVLGSGFTYQDLSGSSFESLYDPAALDVRGNSVVLRMKPMFVSGYSEVRAQMDPEKKRPVRMDFHGRENILLKTIKYTYDLPVYDPRERKKIAMTGPVVMDALDLETGRISRMEFFTLDRKVSPDDSLFIAEFLNR